MQTVAWHLNHSQYACDIFFSKLIRKISPTHNLFLNLYTKRPVTPSGVSTALARSSFIFRNAVRLQEIPDVFLKKSVCHGVLTVTKALLRSSYGVLSRSYGVLVGDPMRSHDAFIALSRRSHCVHCAVTAFALCFYGVCTAPMAWRLKKYANIRNCSNQNLNPALKTKTGNNYMCKIKIV